MGRRWSAVEIQQLIGRYNCEGAANLATDLGRTDDSVISRARVLRLRSNNACRNQAENRAASSPTVNARFFDELNPTVAWVAGVLYSRGSIRINHRHVLKVRVPSDRKWVLAETLKCLECKHSLQPAPRSVVVEIANSYLVRSFINRIGYLPSQLTKHLELPKIPDTLFRCFAAGWLAARGLQSKQLITWIGLKPAIAAMAGEMQKQVDVSSPDWEYGRYYASITWSKADDLEELQRWMSLRETT